MAFQCMIKIRAISRREEISIQSLKDVILTEISVLEVLDATSQHELLDGVPQSYCLNVVFWTEQKN